MNPAIIIITSSESQALCVPSKVTAKTLPESDLLQHNTDRHGQAEFMNQGNSKLCPDDRSNSVHIKQPKKGEPRTSSGTLTLTMLVFQSPAEKDAHEDVKVIQVL